MGDTTAGDLPGRPIRVGIGLIRRGDSFLVRQRPANSLYAGYCEFPGGKCEPGESPADATARECREETGVAVRVGELRLISSYRYPHGFVELHFHNCTILHRELEPTAESGFRWVERAQLAGLTFPEGNE